MRRPATGRRTPARTGCCEAGAISAADLRLGAGGCPREERSNVTADRVVAEVEGAVTTMNEGLAKTRAANRTEARLADPILEDILTQTAGLKFGWRAILLFLTFFVLGMLLESQIHLLYRWL